MEVGIRNRPNQNQIETVEYSQIQTRDTTPIARVPCLGQGRRGRRLDRLRPAEARLQARGRGRGGRGGHRSSCSLLHFGPLLSRRPAAVILVVATTLVVAAALVLLLLAAAAAALLLLPLRLLRLRPFRLQRGLHRHRRGRGRPQMRDAAPVVLRLERVRQRQHAQVHFGEGRVVPRPPRELGDGLDRLLRGWACCVYRGIDWSWGVRNGGMDQWACVCAHPPPAWAPWCGARRGAWRGGNCVVDCGFYGDVSTAPPHHHQPSPNAQSTKPKTQKHIP